MRLLRFTKIVSVLSLLLLVPVFAFGQAISGDVVGTVKDNSGAVVSDASVEATNLGTGFKTTVKTNTGGEYHFVNLPAGHYSVKGSGGGLAGTIADVEVQLNHTVTANVIATPTSSTTTVEVSEQAASVDTTTANISNTFESKQTQDLPTAAVGLGVLNLSLLNAGVASSGGVGAGTGPSISGQRPRNNNYTVEGVDNNDKSVTGPLVTVPNDAVDNFTVLQNNFSAEFGHSSGGQFNQTIKSGTNSFHGRLYEYFQNRNLNAEDSLVAASQRATPGTPITNPRFDDNRFGGQIGGPIIKNKLFFFSNFQYEPQGLVGSASTGFAPTASGYATLSALYPNSTNLQTLQKYLPAAAAADPTLTPICATPGCTTGTIPIGDVGFNGPSYTNILTTTNAIDFNISSKDQLRGRYIYERQDESDTGAQIPTFFTTLPVRFHLFTLSEYHTFSPSVSNEFRLGFNRFAQVFTVPDIQFPGLAMFPNLTFDDLNSVDVGPDPNAPQGTVQNTYQVVDNLSWVKGKHNLKFGAEVRDVISPQQFTQRVRGDYEYSSLALFATDGAPDVFGERSTGDTTFYGNQKAFYAFATDSWRVLPNLSVDLGLRYEFTQVPEAGSLQNLNSISSVPGLINFGTPTAQKKNFMPRVGFAWDPTGKGTTSVRGGFAMANDVLYDNLGILSLPPQLSATCDTTVQQGGGCAWNPTAFLANGGLPSQPFQFSSAADARVNTASFIPNQRLPYSETWNLGIQHSFGQKYVAEVRYVGTRGIHLPVQTHLNMLAAVTPSNALPTYLQNPGQAALNALPNTLDSLMANSVYESDAGYVPAYAAAGFDGSAITAFEPYGQSIYHGLQTQLTRNFNNGLQFQLAYTWSHAEDNSTADVFSTVLTPRRPQDFQCFSCDMSTSALDRRHRFTAQVIYDLPFFKNAGWFQKNIVGNWEFAPVYTFQSPEYATVQNGVDSNLNGDAAGDRAIFNPAGVPGTGSGVTALTNAAGQTVAYLANNPNAQYIQAQLGAMGTVGRNTLALPHTNNWDMTIVKRLNITERQAVEFQAQALNVFNHAQYVPGSLNQINSIGYTGNEVNDLRPQSPLFNQPNQFFSNQPRTMQLVLKYSF